MALAICAEKQLPGPTGLNRGQAASASRARTSPGEWSQRASTNSRAVQDREREPWGEIRPPSLGGRGTWVSERADPFLGLGTSKVPAFLRESESRAAGL